MKAFAKYLVGGIGLIAILYGLSAYVVLPMLWCDFEHQPGLADHPMVTATAQGIPGDPLNVGLVASKEQVVYALSRAGWNAADAITLKSSIAIGLSVILDRPYADAPVSSLFLDGRRQDLAFERRDGQSNVKSADRRHHIRLWRALESGVEGREVWLGAASFDRGVGVSHDTLQITHHIDPDLDRERAFFIASLTGANVVAAIYQVTGAGPTLNGRNGEGDPYYTDGDLTIAVLDPALNPTTSTSRAATAALVVHPSAVTGVKGRLWTAMLTVARTLGIVPQASKQAAE